MMLQHFHSKGPVALDTRNCSGCPVFAWTYRNTLNTLRYRTIRHDGLCPSRLRLRCRSAPQNADKEGPIPPHLTPLPVESLQSLGGDAGHQFNAPGTSGTANDSSSYASRTWSVSTPTQPASSVSSSSSSSSSQQAPAAASTATGSVSSSPPTASKASTAEPGTQPGLPGAWSWLPRLLLPPILPPRSAVKTLARATQLLRNHLWPILTIYALKDLLSFLLHRLSQRLTNLTSDVLLGTAVSQNSNPWWLYLDSAFLESNLGYQACIVVFFLAALPLNILLSSAAATLAALVCTKPQALPDKAPGQTDLIALAQQAQAAKPLEAGGTGLSAQPAPAPPSTSAQDTPAQTQPSMWGPLAGLMSKFSQGTAGSSTGEAATSASAPSISTAAAPAQADATAAAPVVPGRPRVGLIKAMRQGVATAREYWPEATRMLRRVWWVDMLFNMRALPLQALSLLVIPVVWTVPRLLAIQLALPVAVLEGKSGKDALDRSGELMAGLRAAYGWPFITLICAIRLLDVVRNALLAAMPGRWWQEVIEVPLAATAAFSAAKLLVIRLQDLLPLAAYLIATSGSRDTDGDESTMLPAAPTQVPTI